MWTHDIVTLADLSHCRTLGLNYLIYILERKSSQLFWDDFYVFRNVHIPETVQQTVKYFKKKKGWKKCMAKCGHLNITHDCSTFHRKPSALIYCLTSLHSSGFRVLSLEPGCRYLFPFSFKSISEVRHWCWVRRWVGIPVHLCYDALFSAWDQMMLHYRKRIYSHPYINISVNIISHLSPPHPPDDSSTFDEALKVDLAFPTREGPISASQEHPWDSGGKVSHHTAAPPGIITLLMKHSHHYVVRAITPFSHWRRLDRPRAGEEVLLVWWEWEWWQEAGEATGSIDQRRPQPTQTRARARTAGFHRIVVLVQIATVRGWASSLWGDLMRKCKMI